MPSSSSSSAQQARQALADQLRDLRLAAGLTGRALADLAGWHGVSKVSKIEHGARPPSSADVLAWCRICGASPERTEGLLAEQRAAAGMWVSYQRLNRGGLRKSVQSNRLTWEHVAVVRSYQSKLLPGLLQTPGYTEAVLQDVRMRQHVPDDDVSEAVAERMNRQSILRQVGHEFIFVIEESVLRHRLYGRAILRDQLAHLRRVSTLAQIRLGIIPIRADRHGMYPREGFLMFDEDLVSVELISGVLSVTQPHEIAMYMTDFNDLASIAVYGQDARHLIAEAISELA
jgi:transcriptional regulator with XRE-family HTH domain